MENYFTPRLNNRYRLVDGHPSIELKLKTPNQLFDERDPSPFRERDLDDDAARYIVSSFREIPSEKNAKLSLYFASMNGFEGTGQDVIRKAIHSHFEYEAELKRRELKDTFKQGFASLLIGICFLLALTWFSHSMAKPGNADFFRSFLQEWLHLMGWVSMWKPINIFLYEWWPVRNSLQDLRQLSQIDIEIHPLELAPAVETEPRRDSGIARLPLASGLKTS